MMQKFSTPTWFLTLSPAEFLWVEFIQAIGKRYGLSFTEEDVENMEWETKARYLRTNPITPNLMFQHRVECFFNDVLMSTEAPLGNISEYCIKIEFQAHGSPHAHCCGLKMHQSLVMDKMMKKCAILLRSMCMAVYLKTEENLESHVTW